MSAADRFDVVVIGAGHNGLTAAATLARKGKSVCVVDRAPAAGGMLRGDVFGDGTAMPGIAHLLYNLDPEVAAELGLDGLMRAPVLPTVSLAPDGRHVVIEGGAARFADGADHPDAVAYAGLHERLCRYAGLLRQLSARTPPKLAAGPAGLADLAGLAKLGFGVKRLGREDQREFLRVVLSNAYDLVLDEIADGPLAGALCADAVRGNFVGPRSPGTVFTLMYRLGNGGAVRLPPGGAAAMAGAFTRAAAEAGCQLRLGVGVARIAVADDRVTGVVLDDGSEIAAGAVLSSAGPRQTLDLAGAAHFDIEAARRIRNLRCKGSVARLNLLLDAAPAVPGLDRRQMAGRLLIAPSAEAVEAAFNPAKYGELPEAPAIEAVIPTLADPALSGAGQGGSGRHVLSAALQHVPAAPAGGWTEARRRHLIDTAIARLAAHMPGLAGSVVEAALLTPADIEAATGAPGGHWHHAEMGLDQILTLRPVNGMARYRFAVAGLYLCGASAHPGGDISGLPGRNGALQLLRDGVS